VAATKYKFLAWSRKSNISQMLLSGDCCSQIYLKGGSPSNTRRPLLGKGVLGFSFNLISPEDR